MKYLLLFSLFSFLLFSCNSTPSEETTETTEEPVDVGGSQDDPDLVSIDSVIHGFYTWYGSFSMSDEAGINFLDDKGKHLKLDLEKLETYLGRFKATGFVGTEFVENQKAFYKKCEVLWQNEPKDEPASCLDSDPYFCAQDWDMDFWTNAPVAADGLGTNHVVATMSGMEGGVERVQKFDLKKENGKWYITKIHCDMGVE